MPMFEKYDSIDATLTVDEYLLPGTLSEGLQGLYLFNRGLVRGVTNLAPSGLQGGAFVGIPTLNSDGTMTFSGGNTFFQSPIMETVEASYFWVGYSLAPLVGESSQLFANVSGDLGRTPNNTTAGTGAVCNTASTQPDAKLSCATYWGPLGGPSTIASLAPSLDIPQWRTPGLYCVTSGTTEEKTTMRSVTLGTSQSTGIQTTPRYVHTQNPFRVGAGYSGSSAGQTNCICWAVYNRVVTLDEETAFQTWINPILNDFYGYTV